MSLVSANKVAHESPERSENHELLELLDEASKSPDELFLRVVRTIPELVKEGYLTDEQAEALYRVVLAAIVEREVTDSVIGFWAPAIGTSLDHWCGYYAHGRSHSVSRGFPLFMPFG